MTRSRLSGKGSARWTPGASCARSPFDLATAEARDIFMLAQGGTSMTPANWCVASAVCLRAWMHSKRSGSTGTTPRCSADPKPPGPVRQCAGQRLARYTRLWHAVSAPAADTTSQGAPLASAPVQDTMALLHTEPRWSASTSSMPQRISFRGERADWWHLHRSGYVRIVQIHFLVAVSCFPLCS